MSMTSSFLLNTCIWFLLFCLPVSTFAVTTSETDVLLTPEEQAWLKKHPVIRVHNEWSWPPFNYNEDGEPTGLSIDYMNLLASRIGALKF